MVFSIWYNHKKTVIIGAISLVMLCGVIIFIFRGVWVKNEDEDIGGIDTDVQIDDTLDATENISNVITETDSEDYVNDVEELLPEQKSKETEAEKLFIGTLGDSDKVKFELLADSANNSLTGESFNSEYEIKIENHLASFSTLLGSLYLIDGSLQLILKLPEEMKIPSHWLGASKAGSKEVVLASGSYWAGYRFIIPDVKAYDTVIIDLSTRVGE